MESQQRIEEAADELLVDVRVQALSEETEASQTADGPLHQPTSRGGDGASGK